MWTPKGERLFEAHLLILCVIASASSEPDTETYRVEGQCHHQDVCRVQNPAAIRLLNLSLESAGASE